MDIEWINDAVPTVAYTVESQLQFESEFNVVNGEDIGGLIVYNGGLVVYDYENYIGWVKP
jgi:hypothetical protein